ncbi:MAG: hypothetical protein EOM12_18970 [Verrucomicrobiae bacterium]|nr:hypothetical protein [Verrucomicrobiae bacterium]
MKTKILLSALAVVLSVGLVTAQEQKQEQVKSEEIPTQRGPAYLDKDNNAVCDNFENGTPVNPNANGKQRLLDGSGRGRGQAYGMRYGRGRGARAGRGYVDTDESGTIVQRRRPVRGDGLRNGR